MKKKLYFGSTKYKIQKVTEHFIQDANALGIEYILITQTPDDKQVDCNIKMPSVSILAHICALLTTFNKENGITVNEAVDFITKAVKSFKNKR